MPWIVELLARVTLRMVDQAAAARDPATVAHEPSITALGELLVSSRESGEREAAGQHGHCADDAWRPAFQSPVGVDDMPRRIAFLGRDIAQ